MCNLLNWVIIMFAAAVQTAGAQEASRMWHTAVTGPPISSSESAKRFSLVSVTGDPVHIIADYTFAYEPTDKEKTAAVSIDGNVAADGTFRPNFKLEVGDNAKDKWQTVASNLDGTASAQLTIYRGMTVTGLKIELDALRPFIKTMKLAKVVLSDGSETMFELGDIAPPPGF